MSTKIKVFNTDADEKVDVREISDCCAKDGALIFSVDKKYALNAVYFSRANILNDFITDCLTALRIARDSTEDATAKNLISQQLEKVAPIKVDIDRKCASLL
jgi:hypothetical protein